MKPNKLFSMLLTSILFVTGCAAPGEVHSPASSAGTAASQPAISSQPPVSSAPASSKPSPASSKPAPVSSSPVLPNDYKPAVSLNLSFDPRVYVDTFNSTFYFNQKGQPVWWTQVLDGTAGTNREGTVAIPGKHRLFFAESYNTKEYINWIKTNFQDVVQTWGAEIIFGDRMPEFWMSGLRADGTVYWDHEEEMDPNRLFLKTVKSWKDLVYFIGFYTDDAIGLKSDGTVVFAPHRYYKGDKIPQDDGTVSIIEKDPDKTDLEKVFRPELFHDIVMISDLRIGGSQLGLLRKDGVLFNESGEVLFEQVERLFSAGTYESVSYIMLSTGEVIDLWEGRSYGIAKDKDKIVTISTFSSGVCALMEDGSFQIIWCENPYDTSNTQLRALQMVKDCKTN